MSYNTLATAKTRTGEDIEQTLLNDAKSIIDSYTTYRWETVSGVTETISGNSEDTWIQLMPPIISVTSLTIDDIDQTEGTDFEVRKIEGMIRSYSGLPWGHDNIVIVYSYGWQESDQFYQDTFSMVCRVEASIALYLKKNPMMVNSFGIEGFNMQFEGIAGMSFINKQLSFIPRPDFFGVAGPISVIQPGDGDII